MINRNELKLTTVLAPLLFGIGVVCGVIGVGGALICLFMTGEPVWQPIIMAAVTFLILGVAAAAIVGFTSSRMREGTNEYNNIN